MPYAKFWLSKFESSVKSYNIKTEYYQNKLYTPFESSVKSYNIKTLLSVHNIPIMFESSVKSYNIKTFVKPRRGILGLRVV